MNPFFPNKNRFSVPQLLIWSLRISLGIIFLYAALKKWPHPQDFVEQINFYRIIPAQVVPVFAVVLLGLETVLGILLVLGIWKKETAWIAAAAFSLFIAAMISALARGLRISCGCFGKTQDPMTIFTLGRDSLLLVLAFTWVWISSSSRFARYH